MRDPRDVALAAQLACLIEVSTPKPGNVHPQADFADTRYEDFVASALAIGDAMGQAHRMGVGKIVWAAVRDTRRRVGVNTNLGLVLLLAPLAKAAVMQGGGGLRTRLRRVLQGLTVQDARDVYRAIRLAKPGGLGTVDRWDVRETRVGVNLLTVMRAAADRDTVAREYATGFAVIFDVGLPCLQGFFDATRDLRAAILQTSLTILATVPDSLIARKAGPRQASEISREAARILSAGGAQTAAGRRRLVRFDRQLRRRRNLFNPGTTADLTGATLFVGLLRNGIRRFLGH
ncbi:MAG: triphosphoribosyl-dephospho-CoA synthase [Candidatus Methylomirabilales bacterium]